MNLPIPFYVLLLSASLLLTACGAPTPASSFYMLNPTKTGDREQLAGQQVLVAMGQVEISPYIDRSQMVIRTDSNTLSLSEFHKWAEPLEDNIATVVAANLDQLLPRAQVMLDPRSRLPNQYRIELKVSRFDSDTAGHVRLLTQWVIIDSSQRDISYAVVKDSNIKVNAVNGEPAAIAQGMSEALAQLSADIAVALKPLLTAH